MGCPTLSWQESLSASRTTKLSDGSGKSYLAFQKKTKLDCFSFLRERQVCLFRVSHTCKGLIITSGCSPSTAFLYLNPCSLAHTLASIESICLFTKQRRIYP